MERNDGCCGLVRFMGSKKMGKVSGGCSFKSIVLDKKRYETLIIAPVSNRLPSNEKIPIIPDWLVEWAVILAGSGVEKREIFGWGWTNGLEYLDGGGVKWDGIFGWTWRQKDWNIWSELERNIWMELVTIGLEYTKSIQKSKYSTLVQS
jgi:hypothetical protein